MLGRQKQAIEAFWRVQEWLRTNRPANASPAFARQCGEFDDVLERVQRALAHQVAGHNNARGETQALRAAVRQLRDRHLKPLAAIARASYDLIGMDHVCRVPRRRTPVTKLAASARATRDNVRPHAQHFMDYGRPEEFLERLDEAVAAMLRAQARRNRAISLHVGATAALVQHLRRARLLVEVLDCQVRSAFEDDAVKLSEWGVARRVKEKPGAPREVAGEAVASPVAEARDAAAQLRLLIAA